MKTRILMALLAATSTACDNPSPGLRFDRFVTIQDECTFDTGNPTMLGFAFDPRQQRSLLLRGEVTSTLDTPPVQVDLLSGENINFEQVIRVTEFEYQFECDDAALAQSDALFLPGVQQPFCSREGEENIIGFDTVAVAANLLPNQTSIASTRIIPPLLADQLDAAFLNAVYVGSCCGIDGQECLDDQGNFAPPIGDRPESCGVVERLVEESDVNAVLSLAPFATATTVADGMGNFVFEDLPDFPSPDPIVPFAGFTRLDIMGNYRGVTSDGRELTSNDANFDIEMCYNCIAAAIDAALASGDMAAAESAQERIERLECFQ